MATAFSAAPVLVNASRFRAAHAAEWERLEALVTRIEKRSIRALSDEDLLALPLLYRSALSSLSVARETSLDRALIVYLEQLCTRAYFQLYGVPSSALGQLGRFFASGWPTAVRSLWRETLVSFLLTVAAAVVGYLLVRENASWFFGIVGDGMAQGRDPSASAETLRATLYGNKHEDFLATFAAFLFTHNAQIAIFSFALGFAFAVPTALLIVYNGLSLGAFMAVFVPKGLGWQFAGWLTIHGTTELFAIIISGAAGFRIGTAIAFPGRVSRGDAAVQAGKTGATAMAGTVVMLAVAGLLEGIGRQTITDDLSRYGIGLTMLAGWLLISMCRGAAVAKAERPPRLKGAEALRRSFVTPEGVDLQIELGGAGTRAAAFMIDAVAMLLILIVGSIVIGLMASASKESAFSILWLIGFFVLRNGWFVLFEMGGRGATPGKRLMGLRVVARDGARLTGGAVIARNAMREIEVFLPLSFLVQQSAAGLADSFLTVFALGWSAIFLFFPLFNRDRLRIGDLLAGTWVVRTARGELGYDLALPIQRQRRVFTEAALSLYGVFELQTLEAVLRSDREEAIATVAATIRRKAGLADDYHDREFLEDYYAALCARLERGMLVGKRRENKFA